MRTYRIAGLVIVILVISAATAAYIVRRAPAISMPTPVMATTPLNSNSAKRSAPTTPVARTAHVADNVSVRASTTPQPETPSLKDIFADLKARADANDATAASALFQDLRTCTRTRDLQQLLPKVVPSMLAEGSPTDSEEILKSRDAMLQGMQKQLDFVQRNQTFCADLDNATLDQYVPALLKAAQLGDAKAARCYLGGGVEQSSALLDHPEWINDFKQNALSIADQGIRQGDWGVAGLMGRAYQGLLPSSFLSQLTGVDAEKAYQYLKLQRLGTQGNFVKRIDNQIADAAANLTPEQIAQSDAWVQQTYAQYYGRSESQPFNAIGGCGSFDN